MFYFRTAPLPSKGHRVRVIFPASIFIGKPKSSNRILISYATKQLWDEAALSERDPSANIAAAASVRRMEMMERLRSIVENIDCFTFSIDAVQTWPNHF